VAAPKRFPAALAAGIPGMPAATAGGGAGAMPPSAAPERPASGLTAGGTTLQLGGTANAPIAVPRPRAADTAPALPNSPTPAAGAASAPPTPPAAAAPAAASPAASAPVAAPPNKLVKAPSVLAGV